MSGEFIEFERFMIRCIVYSTMASGIISIALLLVTTAYRLLT